MTMDKEYSFASRINLPGLLWKIRVFFIIFYSVGIIGLILPVTFGLFTRLIPFALLLSIAALALFHQGRFSSREMLVYLGIFMAGFLVEVAGVNTGLIFGEYHYGSSLGLKLFNTPLMIGVNWLLLTYLTAAIARQLGLSGFVADFVSAGMMLAYDIILEQMAPVLDMWHWTGEEIPLQNYLAWFILALIFQWSLRKSGIGIRNPMSLVILLCQVFFFLGLFIFYILIN